MSLQYWNKNIISVDCIYKLKLANSFNLPKINSISINIYSHTALSNSKIIIYPISIIAILSNQKPCISIVKKHSSTNIFRKHSPIGVKVNLRKKQAYNFLYLIILFILPNYKKSQKPNIKKTNYKSCISISIGIQNLFSFPTFLDYYNRFQKNTNAIVNINISFCKQKHLFIFFSGLQCFFNAPYK